MCIDVGQGLWVEQNRGNGAQTNTAEFNYDPNNNGFTLIYQGEQLADLEFRPDSGPYQWPILRPEYRSECACCDLCKAQPNPNVSGELCAVIGLLCCVVLCCTVLYCVVLCCVVLCCAVLRCAVLCGAVLHCACF